MQGENLIHQPTLAVLRKVDLQPMWIDRGNAGRPMPNGDHYDEGDIWSVACEILTIIRGEGLG